MERKVQKLADRLRGHIHSEDYLSAIGYIYLYVLEKENPESKVLKTNLKNNFKESMSENERNQILRILMKQISSSEELKEVLIHLFRTIDYSRQTMMASSNDSILNLAPSFFIFDQGTFADFCSGNGAMLSKALDNGAESVKGIEISTLSHDLSVLRLWLEHGQLMEEEITEADVFQYFQKHPDEKYQEIFSQFPLGILRKEDYVFEGISINKKSDWAFIALAMNQLKENGRAVLISSMNVETRKVDEEIRQHFIQKGYIEEIISLPSGILSGTNIPSFLIILSHKNDTIRFTDASEIYSESGRVRYISEEDLLKISESKKQQVEMPIQEVQEKGRLNPSFYLLPELSEGVALEKLVEVLNSRSMTKKEMNDYSTDKNYGYEVIRSSHVKEGKIEAGNLVQGDIEKLVELEDKDLILTRISSNLRVALYQKDNITSFIDENFYVLRVKDQAIDPYYLLAYLQSDLGQNYLLSNYSGVTIQRINKKDLMHFKVPMTDESQEEKIAKEMKEYIEEIERLELKVELAKEEQSEGINQYFKEG
ncbi:MAG: N-6 DNA methylase [Atopostipes suicloacalis]|nr:N-6 DNA methylase [Atopostipes suicloacalis]